LFISRGKNGTVTKKDSNGDIKWKGTEKDVIKSVAKKQKGKRGKSRMNMLSLFRMLNQIWKRLSTENKKY